MPQLPGAGRVKHVAKRSKKFPNRLYANNYIIIYTSDSCFQDFKPTKDLLGHGHVEGKSLFEIWETVKDTIYFERVSFDVL